MRHATLKLATATASSVLALSLTTPVQAQIEGVLAREAAQRLGLPTPEEIVAKSALGWGIILSRIGNLPNRPSEIEAAANRAKIHAELTYEAARRAADACDQTGLARAIAELDRTVERLEGKQFNLDPINMALPYFPRALTVAREYQRKAKAERLRNCPKPAPAPTTALAIPSPTTSATSISNPVISTEHAQLRDRAAIRMLDFYGELESCDPARVAAALAAMEASLREAEAEYARIMSNPSPRPSEYSAVQETMDVIRQWIADARMAATKECPKARGSVATGLIGRLGDGFTATGDSDTWCQFGTTDPGGIKDPGGDDPRDGPAPTGDDPRDGPAPTGDDPRDGSAPTGDDPRDGPAPTGDDPRDGPPPTGPGSGIKIPVPAGDDPRDEPTGDDPRDKPTDDDPRDQPTVPLVVKATSAAQIGSQVQQAVGQQQIKLFAPSQQLANIDLPLPGAAKPQVDASSDPLMCTTGADGQCQIAVPACQIGECKGGVPVGTIPASGLEIEVASAQAKSYNILIGAGQPLPGPISRFIIGRQPTMPGTGADGAEWVTVLATGNDIALLEKLIGQIGGQVFKIEENICRIKEQSAPNDPLFRGAGAWKQDHDDQWAIKRVGFTAEPGSAWTKLGPDPQPVVIAVIDSGLDWNHADFEWRNIWKNPKEIAGNGIDDDRNGYVDDIIGWDFLGLNNKPWDHDGHGTLTTGIIAAATNNGRGMAGINPFAQIMVLKALNAFGRSRASFVAEAIRYAADNGARVVNLSVGGPGLTGIETDAIAYARSKNVLIVVAAGNDGADVKDYGLAANDKVMTVGATGLKDEHLKFSNWGPQVDIAAPGQDVLGLRARRTDTVRGIPDVPYASGDGYVGVDRRYYRASGTSFAAPIVAAVAGLVLAKRPELTVDQLEAVLLQSAQDIQTPGRDNFSGVGLVDARAALDFDPAFRLDAAIAGVEVVQGPGGLAVRVNGVIAADRFGSARIEIGAGREPTRFTPVATSLAPGSGALVDIPATNFTGSPLWTIRLIVTHANGKQREARFVLDVGG
jgi:subtilisin family serine protease